MTDPIILSRLRAKANPPQPKANWALFLDLDGTLLDLAPSPDRVNVPPDLVGDLGKASVVLGGALAIASGRTLSEVDTLLSPLRLPGGGEHGAVVRLPDGRLDEIDAEIPRNFVDKLIEGTTAKAGVVIEGKRHGLVAHFRRAAQHEQFCRDLCNEIILGSEGAFEVLDCHMAVEIRPRTATKARVVQRLMAVPPFRGRSPVFVGDDVTDHDGFRAVETFAGEPLDVATRFAGRPREVRRWLKAVAELQSGSRSESLG